MMGLVLCRAGAAAMSLNIAQAALIGSGGGACRSQHSAGTAGRRSARKFYRLLAKARVGNSSSSSRRESESGTGFWGTGRATSRLGRRLRPSRLPLAAASLRPRTAPPPRPPLSFSSSGCWHWNALKTKGLITRAAIWLFCFSSAHEEEMRDVYGALCAIRPYAWCWWPTDLHFGRRTKHLHENSHRSFFNVKERQKFSSVIYLDFINISSPKFWMKLLHWNLFYYFGNWNDR